MPEGGGMIGYISLPLMRIENVDSVPAEWIHHSLPLMGIENDAASATAPAEPHYPSWGSKTTERSLDHAVTGIDLITPHGDRKLRDASISPAERLSLHAHYPSWGSKTR